LQHFLPDINYPIRGKLTRQPSTDPEFIAKVREVVGLYMSPPENALVLCVDEKSQIQALDRAAPCLPMLPMTRPG
jgi:hypothetical protein